MNRLIMTFGVLLVVAAAGFLVTPAFANASDSYTITRNQAQLNTRDAARTLYGEYGVTFDNTIARCRPQGTRYDRRYTYHRWVCGWANDTVSGTIRITGHSGNNYGYLVLSGARNY